MTERRNTKLHKQEWVAEQLGISVRHVYRLADSGDLTRIRLGRLSRITDESFQRYFRRLEEESA